MAKNIEPKLMKIKDYLTLEENAVFEIPEYQRPYSWEIGNCDKLWQDITDFVGSDNKDRYFFGTVIISCVNHDSVFDLIDGQQRTTTFLLLLKALLIRINEALNQQNNDDESVTLYRGLRDRRRAIMSILYKVEADNIPDVPNKITDGEIYQNSSIMKNASINEIYKTELESILRSGDDEVEFNVAKIPRKKKENKYTNFFRNFKFFYEKAKELELPHLNEFTRTFIERCEVIEIKSWQVEQAVSMFNSLNSDGMPLYDADIISAKLYAVADKNQVSVEYQELWKEFKDLIDELKQKGIADIDAIFTQQMYYERAIGKEVVSDTGAIIVTTPGLRRYFTEINKSLLNDPIALCRQLVNLSKVWIKTSEYPIVQTLLKFNKNVKHFLAGYFHRFDAKDVSPESIQVVAECLLRLFTILELVDVGYSSAPFKTFLFGEIVKLVDDGVSAQQIKADFDKHISERWNEEKLKKEVMEYDGNLLIYLNEYLCARERGIAFEIGPKCDVEHIMPVSGADKELMHTAQISSKEEYEDVVNKLGNKILLEEKINRSLGNAWFQTKVSTRLSEKTGYIDSTYPVAQSIVEEYGENSRKLYWTKKDIERATAEISERIVKFIFGN